MDNEKMQALSEKYDEIFGKVPALPDDSRDDPENNPEYDELTRAEEAKEEDTEVLETESEEASEPAGDEDEYEEIPDDLVEAARAYGFTDQEIVRLAEDSPKTLEALAEAHKNYITAVKAKQVPPSVKTEAEKASPQEQKKEKLEYLEVGNLEDFDEGAQQVIKSLVKSHNKLIDQLNKVNEQVSSVDEKTKTFEAAQQQQFETYIDGLFDAIDDVPQIGKSSSLTPQQDKTRQEIYNTAVMFQRISGGTIEDNLIKAVKAFKGIYAPKNVESDVIKKLNANKKRFTARPRRPKATKQYASEEERVLSVMDEVGQKLGIKWTG